MDLKAMATQMLMAKLGGGDQNAIGNALSGLLGGDDSSNDLDLGGLVGKFTDGNLAGAVQSWLGDGDNDQVSAGDITNALGADKVSAFAQQLGVDQESAASGLQDLIPQLIDKNSSGGDLLGGLGGLASKLFK